ncbi:hypothetical protein MASR1M12_00890 [Erysipelotrichia bacterium]
MQSARCPEMKESNSPRMKAIKKWLIDRETTQAEIAETDQSNGCAILGKMA